MTPIDIIVGGALGVMGIGIVSIIIIAMNNV